MKKVFALILCLILTLSVLVACSDKEETPADTTAAATTAAATTKEEETTKKPRPQSTQSTETTAPETYPVLDYTPEY
ncbi:MAG: hypothetical protein IKA44_05420 [Clostridia bacterium]|nr:hypothetical protein [Clostridia bacterium]